jgi:AmmeMemoRadiSam system protein A
VRTGKKYSVESNDARLSSEEGAFVTIRKKGYLRGCIGNIIGRRPLYVTVRDMAISAASSDPRFPPVEVEELDDLEVEVSVLSKPRVIKDVEEIQLGVHGVIVSQGPFHSGVFLPQVAEETQWTKEEFLSQLCAQKAQLPADAWKNPKTKIEIFTAEVFSEKDVH